MKKHKNKKQLAVLTAVFALTLVTAFVYAALTGELKFTGSAKLAESDLQLIFVWPPETQLTGGKYIATKNNSRLEATLVDDDQEMHIEAEFAIPNEILAIDFYVKNIGTLPALFESDEDAFHLDVTCSVEGCDTEYEVLVIGGGFEMTREEGGGLKGAVIPYGDALVGYNGLPTQPLVFNIQLHEDAAHEHEPIEGAVYTFTLTMNYDVYEES